ncbi:HEPN domain-containing protein [Cryobacterium sp. TMT4-31]|uniref:ApeA N-terminal domain 1-containing protein n=1 Tax=Cryobacterium sp. TMT4-31 TaxID=1259259 RepID=UPI00106AB024|nr:HEPN domain-containing protein [Cryobacterium sp. TMT4-31]TFC87679.1 hypothetical protein E3T19_11770 [Cryobacterium sp. TMT4-31]
MNEPLLNEPRTWTGQWWLPNNPEDKVSGILTYVPQEGLRLRLIGGWDYAITTPGEDGSTLLTGKLQRWPAVFGIGDGKYVTLLDVQVASAKTFSLARTLGVPDNLELGAGTALVGCHVDDPEKPVFVAGIAAVENMTKWSSRSSIAMKFQFEPEAGQSSGQIELTRQAPLVAEMGTLIVKLHLLGWLPYAEESRAGRTARVKEHASIEFSCADPKPLSYWTELAASIADLISLSTLSACGLITLRVFLPPTPEKFPEDHPQRDQPHEVEVYQPQLVPAQPDMKAEESRTLLLTLDDRAFTDLVPQWLSVRDTFASARSMILGLQYVTGGYIETRVVTAVGAAEAMHRALNPEPPIPVQEFRELRRSLLATVPQERKAWLADRLTEHSNVPTLKQRLIELAGRIGAPGEALVASPEMWARAAKDARNAIAHVGSSDHDIAKLHAVVEVTAAVVILNLLFELEVPEDRLVRAVAENPTLSRAAVLAREFLSGD